MRTSTIILLLFFTNCNLHAQKGQSKFSIKSGWYKPIIYKDSSLGMNWYFNRDSRFFHFTNYPNGIKLLGRGSWKCLDDSIIELTYQSFKTKPLRHVTIEYNSKTEKSCDSVYIEGSIQNTNGSPFYPAVIHFNDATKKTADKVKNTDYGVSTDPNGYFRLVIHRYRYPDSLSISFNIGYKSLLIKTIPANNCHVIKIQVDSADLINSDEYELQNSEKIQLYRLNSVLSESKRNDSVRNLRLFYKGKGKVNLLEMLNTATIKNMNLCGYAAELIEMLEKDE